MPTNLKNNRDEEDMDQNNENKESQKSFHESDDELN